MLRKLLYHRGIDDNTGTYITDYALAVVCSCSIAILLWKSCRSPKASVTRSTKAVLLLLGIIGIVAFLGGLPHQFLQTVEPYESWRNNWTWLIVWRVGTAISSGSALAFLVLAQQLLSQEGVLRPRRICATIYYILVGGVVLTIVIQSFFMLSHQTDPWSVKFTLACIFVTAFIDWIAATVVAFKRLARRPLPKDDDSSTNLAIFSEKDGELKKDGTLLDEDAGLPKEAHPWRFRWDILLHALAPFVFIFGGVLQLILGRTGCADHDNAYEENGCPLPNSFNHNALMHVMHMCSVVMFLVAETLAIDHRQLTLLRTQHSNSGGSIHTVVDPVIDV